ncbi:MAG: hypothetical protein K8T26_16735 [Lentisphaerae bacterium]|nr:hypothetical protein [Lentisphaerota bacterium]
MHRMVAFFTLAILACVAWATELIPCPDCEQPVSPRAVMCPRCGCPGDVITEAAALRSQTQEPAPSFPIVHAITERSRGFAIAYAEGDARFLVVDANLVADASSLEILPLGTNTPVAYQRMQVAKDAGLVRFETPETNLLFLARAATSSADAAGANWLMPDGGILAAAPGTTVPDGALASVDSSTNLVGILCRDSRETSLAPLPLDRTWLDVAPNAFRLQMGLLAKAEEETATARISDETAKMLEETQWLSAYFAKRARSVIARSKEDRKP